MKYILLVLCIFISSKSFGDNKNDLKYFYKVTKALIKNPDNLGLIIEAGTYSYKRKQYAKAIWYWSSPKLIKHRKYADVKYYQALSHIKLKEYNNAIYVLKQIDLSTISKKFKNKILVLLNQLRPKMVSKKMAKTNTLSLYGISLAFEELAKKESGNIGGLYYARGEGKSNFEFSYEYLTLGFEESLNYEDYSQHDIAIAYSLFNKNLTSNNRLLYHKTFATSSNAISSDSFLYGYKYYYAAGESLGIETSYSTLSSKGREGETFQSYQLSPNLNFSLTNNIYIALRANLAEHSYAGNPENLDNEIDKSSTSYEAQFGFYWKYIDMIFYYMTGSERFLLKSDGFMVQNSTDETISSTGISLNLSVSDSFSLSGKYKLSKYLEEANTSEYQAENFMLLFNFYF
ncbi:MAG: hypothetical protein HON90_01020 [Halobacteriovoraceae bacterium]|nr:hypothetical protein [Halobacteriovoraceae bacterium]